MDLMAAPAQVTWAKLAGNGKDIEAIGGIRKSLFGKAQWQLSTDEAIALMEQDEWRFFVEIEDQKEWLDIDEDPDGTKTLSVDGPVRSLI